jgi:hypothetical protein
MAEDGVLTRDPLHIALMVMLRCRNALARAVVASDPEQLGDELVEEMLHSIDDANTVMENITAGTHGTDA